MPQSPPDSDVERLRRALLDSGESPDEAESLAQVAHFLRQLPAVQAPADASVRLQQRLVPIAKPMNHWDRLREWPPLVMLFSQIRVIQGEIWWASALVLIIGTFVTVGVPANSGLIPLAVIAPVVAAIGIALLYDDEAVKMLELEDSTPMSARMILLARLTLLFGFDLLLALIGSLVLSLVRADYLLMPLVLSWLAPMTFLSGLAFFLAVLLRESLAGYGLCLLLWMIHIIFRSAPIDAVLRSWLSLPGLSNEANRPLLFISAMTCVAVALWWVGQGEKRMSYDASY